MDISVLEYEISQPEFVLSTCMSRYDILQDDVVGGATKLKPAIFHDSSVGGIEGKEALHITHVDSVAINRTFSRTCNDISTLRPTLWCACRHQCDACDE